MKTGTVVITTGEYYELVAADVKLDLITTMLQDRLDKTGFAKINDICSILGIEFYKMEEGNDE